MKLAVAYAGAVLLVAASGVFAAQKEKPAPPPKAAKIPPAPRANAAKGNPGNANKGGTPKKGGAVLYNPLNPVQRLSQMTPEQRERILEQLPPDRHAQMRKQLENFDRLPPAQKERLSRLAQPLVALPPEKQRVVNQGIFGINHLSDDRKPPVARELRSLLNMTPDDRTARLNSSEFKKAYSPEEQKILSDLSNNLPPDYPIAGRK